MKASVEQWATVEREGYVVPLIGIAPDAVMETCDKCRANLPSKEIQFTGSQMLCKECRNETPKADQTES